MNILLAVVLGLVGVAFAAIGSLGLRGRLRRNPLVGVRTKAALRDDEAFALANRVAGVPNAGAGAVALVCGLVVLFAPTPATALVVSLIGLIGAVALAVAGGLAGHRAAAALPEPEPAGGCGGCACAGACSVLTKA
ncbi:SdpI family protein [Saccharothrix sp. BKS2]|uniref:SdpI family protein n=1 Tax=Saccharothrix sp. BKS2 TaxID=3064400 RepID=UPI0039EBD029